jgi:hypothetical protein
MMMYDLNVHDDAHVHDNAYAHVHDDLMHMMMHVS